MRSNRVNDPSNQPTMTEGQEILRPVSAQQPKTATMNRATPLTGRVRVSGDRFLSHLAVMLGCLSTGITRISDLARSDGVLRTMAVVEAFGGRVHREGARIDIYGRGVGGLGQPRGALDCGTSLIASHLALGAVAGHDMTAELVGGSTLAALSLQPVLAPLRQMGLGVAEGRSHVPLIVRGSGSLVPIVHSLPTSDELAKYAVLLAGLAAPGRTSVIEPSGAESFGANLMLHLGAEVAVRRDGASVTTTVGGDGELEGRDIAIPGDLTLAILLAAGAAIVPDSDIVLEGVPWAHGVPGPLAALAAMGVDAMYLNPREDSGIPIADVRVRYRSLGGSVVSRSLVDAALVELPILIALATSADGETRFEGARELAAQGGQLAEAMAHLQTCGVRSRFEGDDLIVGSRSRLPFKSGLIADPVTAVAGLLIGLGSDNAGIVMDGGSIAHRFPELRALLARLGGQLDT